MSMRACAFLLALLSIIAVRPAAAADMGAVAAPVRYAALTTPAKSLPFPRSERSQAVWASGVCWSQCGAYCTSGLVGCLSRDSQGQCLKYTDRCDRYCQNQCRTQGGPLLPDLLDF
jgi:hypothetical protein